MKRSIALVAMMLCLAFTCFSCGSEPKSDDVQKGWDRFTDALIFTSSLDTFSINIKEETGERTVSGKLILTKDGSGNYIAYKKLGSVEAYFVNGFCYQNDGRKTKQAMSINTFLEISADDTSLQFTDASNIFYKKSEGVISFNTEKNGKTVSVYAEMDDTFVTTLQVKYPFEGSEKTVTYQYEQIGSQPRLEIPELSEYTYQLP